MISQRDEATLNMNDADLQSAFKEASIETKKGC